MASNEWQEQKSKRKKNKTTNGINVPLENQGNAQYRIPYSRISHNPRNENVSFEPEKIQPADITIWMKCVMDGDIEPLVIDELNKLQLNVDGNLNKLWDCLFEKLSHLVTLNETITEGTELRNQIYALNKKRNFNDHDAIENLTKRNRVKLIFHSIDKNLKQIVYGPSNDQHTIQILHIGLNCFLPVKYGQIEQKFQFTEENKKTIRELNILPTTVKVTQYQLDTEKKALSNIRKILSGFETAAKYYTSSHRNNKRKLEYDIYSPETLNDMKDLILCKLKFINAHSGKAIPIYKTTDMKFKEIKINNRRNCGYNAFENDTVYVRINDSVTHTGKVMGVYESSHKPINSIFICKVSRDQGTLMSPLDKSIPKIHVDNEPGRRKYEANLKDKGKSCSISEQQKSVVDKEKESANYADNIYYSVFQVSIDKTRNCPKFEPKSVSNFNPETCEFFFIVCYEYWDPNFMYPNGKIVGILSSHDSLTDNFHLVTSICNIEPLDITKRYDKEIMDIKRQSKSIVNVPGTYIPLGAMVFTIDNETTKDMDDAISYHKEGVDTVIGIHISDVTKFISSTHEIYQQAEKRFCTFYPPKFCNISPIHILDEKLATDILSLKPNEPRAVVSVFFRFSEQMQSVNFELSDIPNPAFREGVIVSKYKLNYEEVSEWIRESEMPQGVDADLVVALRETYKLTKQLRRARLPESYFVRTLNDFYKDFQIDNKFEAQILIEEFMLLANEHVAKKIYEKYPNFTLLRMQEPVKSYEEWIEKLFQSTNMNFTAQLKEYCNLLRVPAFNNEKKKGLVVSRRFYDKFNEFMTTDMEKARNLLQYDVLYNDFYVHITEWYGLSNSARYECSLKDSVSNGHFSLNKPLYTHFTSPIRRFTDIVVHRLLKSIINNIEITDNSLDINEVCLTANKKSKCNKTFEKICASFAIVDETEKKFCFILDCACNEINEEELRFAHPMLQKASSVKGIKFKDLSLDEVPKFLLDDDRIESCTLKWRKIIFSCPPNNSEISTTNKFTIDNHAYDSCLHYSKDKLFREIRRSYQNIDVLRDKLISLKNSFENHDNNTVISSDCISIADPIIDIDLKIFVKNTMRIQFCKYKINALQKINPELYILSPTFQICLIHRDDPVRFFISGGKLNLKHNEIKKRFESIKEYKEYFEPLIHVESLTETLGEHAAFTLLNAPIIWKIGFSPISSTKERYGIIMLSYGFCKSRNIIFSDETDEIIDRYEYYISKGISSIGGDLLCLRYKKDNWENYWVGHGEVVKVGKIKTLTDSFKVIVFLLTQFDYHSFSNSSEDVRYTVDVYLKSVVSKRQQEAVASIDNHQLLKDVILGSQELSLEIDYSIIENIRNEIEQNRQFKFNHNQYRAVTNAMTQPLSLIWGPPGTGKTHIGCILSYAFVSKNRIINKRGVILYCGPSNDCVNLVALEMKRRFCEKCPKLLRIFGEQQELADFPLPGFFSKNHSPLTGEMQEISLHYLIRNQNGAHAEAIRNYDLEFRDVRQNSGRHNREEIHDKILAYKEMLRESKQELIKNNQYDMVLCTTSVTATKIMKLFNVVQIIIDEAGMCKEPETLIPISSAEDTVEHVVLIGDHKQLRPIIRNKVANKRGLQISLFERYQELRPNLVTMLNFQYRMHPSICEFPSREFYFGRLKTQISNLWSGLSQDDMEFGYKFHQWNGIDYYQMKFHYKAILKTSNYSAIPNESWPGVRGTPYRCFDKQFDIYPERIVFIHLIGDETIQSVSTVTGNENSRGNEQEVEALGYVYKRLIERLDPPRTSPKHITVLTQYKLQQHLLNEKCKKILKEKHIKTEPIVKTVIRSQGSENDYIMFSTVRSLRNRDDINNNPSPGWEKQYLGFITDPNQINVALTRAKKGLIIFGNKELLRVNKIWKRLINDLENRNCVLENYLDFI